MPQSNSPSRRAHRHLSLVLPQLLDVGPALVDCLRDRPVATPALERLLRRGCWHASAPVLPVIDEQGLAAAPLALLGEGETPGSDCWWRADPVHLLPDQDHLLLWDAAALSLSDSEAIALVEAFNRHFAEDGLCLRAVAPARWYLRSERDLIARTTPVAAVAGKNPFHVMPSGPDAKRLEQLINESQMLFHEHPVNQRRRSEGQLTVSGVWPWGGGRLTVPEETAGIDRVLSDEPLYRGLARQLGLVVQASCPDFATWQQQSGAAHDLLVLDQGSEAARLGDDAEWHATLLQLERDWWAPLSRALWWGRLSGLRLCFGAWGELVIDPWRLRRVWRRPRPLSVWLQDRSGQGA